MEWCWHYRGLRSIVLDSIRKYFKDHPLLLFRAGVIPSYLVGYYPCWICEYNRCHNLTLRNIPILFKQSLGFYSRQKAISVSLIEPNGPCCCGPCANQNRALGHPLEMLKQLCSNPIISPAGPYVGMPDEGDVASVLNSHNADEVTVFLNSPEHNAVFYLTLQVIQRHVWVLPSVIWDDAFVCLGGIVNNGIYRCHIVLRTLAYHLILDQQAGQQNELA